MPLHGTASYLVLVRPFTTALAWAPLRCCTSKPCTCFSQRPVCSRPRYLWKLPLLREPIKGTTIDATTHAVLRAVGPPSGSFSFPFPSCAVTRARHRDTIINRVFDFFITTVWLSGRPIYYWAADRRCHELLMLSTYHKQSGR